MQGFTCRSIEAKYTLLQSNDDSVDRLKLFLSVKLEQKGEAKYKRKWLLK